MVRPHASEGCKKLAVAFATTATVEVLGVAPASASVGRYGNHSIFESLSICFPQASRDYSRSGVSLVELNKLLEKEGFTRVRFRNPRQSRRGKKASFHEQRSRKWRDPDNQSFYRYGNRRWRNPDDPSDLAFLHKAWPLVNSLSPTTPCCLQDFLHILRSAIAADLESEAVQRKLVGLEPSSLRSLAATPLNFATCSIANSEATTPARSTPVSTIAAEELSEHDDALDSCSTDSQLSDDDDGGFVQTFVFRPDIGKYTLREQGETLPSASMAVGSSPAWETPMPPPSLVKLEAEASRLGGAGDAYWGESTCERRQSARSSEKKQALEEDFVDGMLSFLVPDGSLA